MTGTRRADETADLLVASQHAILVAGFARRIDLALLREHLERWDTLGPMLDPTAWIASQRSAHPLGENVRLLKIILPGLAKLKADLEEYLGKLPEGHELRQRYEAELSG